MGASVLSFTICGVFLKGEEWSRMEHQRTWAGCHSTTSAHLSLPSRVHINSPYPDSAAHPMFLGRTWWTQRYRAPEVPSRGRGLAVEAVALLGLMALC